MTITVYPMETFAQTPEGREIIRTAHEGNLTHLTQRLAPSDDKEDANGAYLVMILDWPNGMMIKLLFNEKEIDTFSKNVNELAHLGVLDAFTTKGATVQ